MKKPALTPTNKICAAQLECTVGAIEENLEAHVKLIKLAIVNEARMIVFPELSITGYCREEAESLAFSREDDRLTALRELATSGNIIVIAGAPIRIDDFLYIGSFILLPDGSIDIYTKQYLHTGEELFYASSMHYNPKIQIESETIALAICADIDNPQHPTDAKCASCSVYMPSIFFSSDGIDNGAQKLGHYAQLHSMCILMSNYCGSHWGTEAGGESGFWTEDGTLVAALDKYTSGLVLACKDEDCWTVRLIENEKIGMLASKN